MRKRKVLLHAAFWLIYLLPDLLNGLINFGKQSFAGYQFILLAFSASVFYLLTEAILPFCLKKDQKYKHVWLLMFAFWIVASYGNMELENFIANIYDLDAQPSDFINYLVGMFWFMLIAAGISLGQYWYEKQLQAKDVENLVIKAELANLRYRVSPHFLFNTLNNLYALTLAKSDKAPQVVLQLSQLMRYMLQDDPEKVYLKQEIDYLKSYLELEKIRLGDAATISMNISGEIKDQKIPPMTLLPFVENSFKHGLNRSVAGGYVIIEIQVTDEELFFYIENSFAEPIALPSPAGKTGIGLKNLYRRLELLYGKERFNLEVDKQTDKYCVNFYLNFQE
ncbi:sensor histidine kinase [Rhodoflexus sp.]